MRLEIEAALTRNVRVIPILVDGARMPRADELPPSLAGLVRRQALELSPARFDFDTSRLLKVLDRTLAEVRTAQAATAASTTAPAGKAPDPRTTAPPTPAERREQAEPSPPTSIPQNISTTPAGPSPSDLDKRPEKTSRRLSTRARVLAGAGALVAVILVLIAIAAANSPEPPTQTVGPSSGVSMSSNVTPARADSDTAVVLASFEKGTEGWLPNPDQKDNGTVSQASDFHTLGSFSLRIDNRGLPGRGWYGKNFDSPIDISGRTVSVDISDAGGGDSYRYRGSVRRRQLDLVPVARTLGHC